MDGCRMLCATSACNHTATRDLSGRLEVDQTACPYGADAELQRWCLG